MTEDELIVVGRRCLETEARSLMTGASRLDASFAGACRAILSCGGKVVTTGLGKSGHVARKVASTLSSTGTSAFFLHPTEALHGDFGMVQKNDCLVALAFGGETPEVLEVSRYARRIGIPVIAITGNLDSTLAKLAHFVLDGGVAAEADPLNLAPTCSSTLAIGLGDAIAVTLMEARGFNAPDFASLHPGGSLGRRLSLVKDHMHTGDRLPKVDPTADFHRVLEAVTAFNFGIVAVVDGRGCLAGAISDGDVRRLLHKKGGDALATKAEEIMTKAPKTVPLAALAIDAVRVMNERQITQLFVVSSEGEQKLVGIVRLHDLLAAKIL